MKIGNVLGIAFFAIAALGGVTSVVEGSLEKQMKESERVAQAKATREAEMAKEQQAASQAKADFLKVRAGGNTANAAPVDKQAALKKLRQSLKSSRYDKLVVNVRNSTSKGIAKVVVNSKIWDEQTDFEKRGAAQSLHAQWKRAGHGYATQTDVMTTKGTVLATVVSSSQSPLDKVTMKK